MRKRESLKTKAPHSGRILALFLPECLKSFFVLVNSMQFASDVLKCCVKYCCHRLAQKSSVKVKLTSHAVEQGSKSKRNIFHGKMIGGWDDPVGSEETLLRTSWSRSCSWPWSLFPSLLPFFSSVTISPRAVA